MTEPFADADKLRAGFGNYESALGTRPLPSRRGSSRRNPVPTLVLYGPEDHVISRDFPERCEVVFTERVGPFVVPRAGHFLQWERADVLNQSLIYFLADLGRSRCASTGGSRVLLTGATGGIGHAIARTLHARGAT